MSNSDKKELVITRVFDAPKALVFDTFTKAEHLKNWWGPEGFSIEVLKLELKVGGNFHYIMKSPNGYEMYGLFTFKEISAPDKLVFSNAFSNKEGKITKAPLEGDFPLEIINTFTFTESNGKTTMKLVGSPIAANQEEAKGFSSLNEDMNNGYNKTFDQLENYISVKFKLRNQLKTNNMARTSTYLNFPGNTEEAFNFYKIVFKTEFHGDGIKRFGDIPASAEQPPLSDSDKKLILHVELPILGGHILMATDAPESMGFTVTPGNNVHINLEPDSREETKRLFDALSKGGNISMPLQDMFWGAYYGSCADKYGINWMVNYSEIK